MSTRPHVAVLLATFNGRPWIQEQIDTILAQRDVDLSIIVSDDGSSDGTVEFIQELARSQPCISLMPQGPPSGSSAANFLRLLLQVDLDRFDYFALADQDDVWLPEKLARAIGLLSQHHADGYSANVIALFENGRQKLVEKAAPQQRLDHYFESPGPGCSFVMTRRMMRQLVPMLRAIDGSRDRLFAYHDWFIYAFARRAGFAWYIDPMAPMLYRQHEHNVLGANIGVQPRLRRLKSLWSGWYFDEVCWQYEVLEAFRTLMPDGTPSVAERDFRIDTVGERLRFVASIAPHARRRWRDRLWLGVCIALGIIRSVDGKDRRKKEDPAARTAPHSAWTASAQPDVRSVAAQPAGTTHDSTVPLRLLHVGKFAPPPFAGIESHIDTLLRSMPPEVASTLVACEPLTPSPVRREPTPYRLLTTRSYGTLASVALSPSLRRVVRQEFAHGRANLLHVHAPNPWGDLAALDASPDTPVVMTWHSDVVRKTVLMALYGGIQRKALQRADRVVVFTPKHFESSQQLRVANIESKLVHIPIGIDFERLERLPVQPETAAMIDAWVQGRPLLLSVGRQVYYKGYGHLIKAMSILRQDAVLLLIGTGPLGMTLRRQAAALKLTNRVRFLGEVDLPTLVTALRRCDIFCLPSIERSEAFGIASAEAMSFGKPTIVCELNNGVNYLNRAGTTSVVTPPRDEAALADAIDQLSLDQTLRSRMGDAAKQWVHQEFAVQRMRDSTLSLYRSLV